jgi:hypothetical protein
MTTVGNGKRKYLRKYRAEMAVRYHSQDIDKGFHIMVRVPEVVREKTLIRYLTILTRYIIVIYNVNDFFSSEYSVLQS